MLVSRVYLGINVFQINIEREGKENLASVSTIMTGTEEFTLIVASRQDDGKFKDLYWNSKPAYSSQVHTFATFSLKRVTYEFKETIH